MLFVLILILIDHCQSFYDVPSYYGHWSRNFFLPQIIKSGTFRYFEFHYSVDLSSDNNTVYFANTAENCIESFDLTTNIKRTLAGICGQEGDRVGGVNIMLLNGPSSIVFYQENEESKISEKNMKINIVANSTCDVTEIGCIMSSVSESTILTMENLRAYPEIIQFPNISATITKYLYISDTENHCIKRINLEEQASTVIAGECGESGFTDGPTSFNRLNRPTNLGITRNGVLYFFDEGNEYIRKVETDGSVYTMLNGACKYFYDSRSFGGYKLKNVLCYDNWIEGKTADNIQHILDDTKINICIEHSSKC